MRATDAVYTPDLPFVHKGFFDSHLHVGWMGFKKRELDVSGCRSFEELLSRVRGARGSGEILRAHGWNEAEMGLSLFDLEQRWERERPEGQPLFLVRACGHSALVNSALVQRLGLTLKRHFVSDRDLWPIYDALPHPSEADFEAALIESHRRLLEVGVSAVGDMSLDELACKVLKKLVAENRLLIDVQGVIDAGKAPTVEFLGPLHLQSEKNSPPLGRPALLSIRHWKKFLDGSLGSRTAWLSQPYDDSLTSGESLQENAALVTQASEAVRNGFHLSFHALGDAALDQVLRLGERLRPALEARVQSDLQYGLPKTLHRIEHAQVIRHDQVATLKEQGFWALCVQPHHRVSDDSFVRERLGKVRWFDAAYRARSLIDSGIALTLGSDAPIDDFDPRVALDAAVTHHSGQEALTWDEALWLMTTGARLALGLPAGQIAAGSDVFLSSRT